MGRAIRKHVFRHMRDSEGPDQIAQLSGLFQGRRCPLTESLAFVKCINGEQRPGLDFKHAHYDMNLRMFKNTFSLVAA